MKYKSLLPVAAIVFGLAASFLMLFFLTMYFPYPDIFEKYPELKQPNFSGLFPSNEIEMEISRRISNKFDKWTIALQALFLYSVMVLGMLSKQVFDLLKKELQQGRETADIKAIFLKSLKGTSFLMAVCFSPFIFYGIYYLVREVSDDPKAILLAYQNGFFWYNVFERKEKDRNDSTSNRKLSKKSPPKKPNAAA